MEKIDLHIHTNVSDGILMPKQVIDVAVKNGVSVISIADHDAIDAYTKELFDYAWARKVKLITGVEISAKKGKIGVHVLGYNVDIQNSHLKDELNKLRNARHIYLYDVAKKLNSLGYYINLEELDKIDAVSKAHIALNVIENEENKELLIQTFHHIPSKGEFIETIMNESCPAYVEKNTITPADAAKIIREAGGKVVLAHPVAYFYEDHLSESDIQELVDEMHPDGIESNYIYIDKDNHTIDEIQKWTQFARRNHLFTTFGSDYHNSDNIHPEIGFVNKNIDYSVIQNEHIIDNILN